MNEFLLGVTAMGCLVAALFFVRFWRSMAAGSAIEIASAAATVR